MITLSYDDGKLSHVRKHATEAELNPEATGIRGRDEWSESFVSVRFGNDFDVFIHPRVALELANRLHAAALHADPSLAPVYAVPA